MKKKNLSHYSLSPRFEPGTSNANQECLPYGSEVPQYLQELAVSRTHSEHMGLRLSKFMCSVMIPNHQISNSCNL
jgi:hypothetical protein